MRKTADALVENFLIHQFDEKANSRAAAASSEADGCARRPFHHAEGGEDPAGTRTSTSVVAVLCKQLQAALWALLDGMPNENCRSAQFCPFAHRYALTADISAQYRAPLTLILYGNSRSE